MPGKNGLEVALATHHLPYHLIFITAYNEYALRAFETQAIDYLLKPVTEKRLKQSIEKIDRFKPVIALEQLQAIFDQISPHKSKFQIGIRHGSATLIIDAEHIAYIEAEKGYNCVQLNKEGHHLHGIRSLLSDTSLDQFMLQLPSENFLRVHRSAIVNINQVKSYHSDGRSVYILLKEFPEIRISVSRSSVALVKKRWGIL